MSIVHLRRIAASLAVVLLGVWPLSRSVAAGPNLTPLASSVPTFSEPTISGVQGNGFEEDLRLDNSGRIYTSSPGSLSSTVSFMWRSLDGGKTFKWVPGATQPLGKLITCPGGGDSELATDSAGNLYFNDLTLANFSTARSSDQGTTFAPVSCSGVPDAGVDRQWYAVDGNPTVDGNIFLAYDRVDQSQPVTCPNGTIAQPGQNFLVVAASPLPAGQAEAGVQYGPSQPVSCDEGIMGNDEFFNYADTGKRVFVVHDNAALTSVSMARCDYVGFGSSTTALGNCVDNLISSFPNAKTGANFPTMAIDSKGNLYAVWEQAPTDGSGKVIGNSVLMFSTSTDEGNTWSSPRQVPTGSLNNNVFAWIAAGDPGRIDIAWYGTPATCDNCGGPDYVNGDWSLYMTQSLDDGTTWTAPVLASEHFTHRGNIQTVMGGQVGDRTLGDFLQLRIGQKGDAYISYADSNNVDESSLPHAMFVRQNGGPSVFASVKAIKGPSAPRNHVSDPRGDATFDSGGVVGPDLPNLDILKSSVSMPDANDYQVKMTVADLRSLVPSPSAGGPDLVWLTQWLVPSQTDPLGGKNFFVYFESYEGGAPTCWAGENALEAEGGGVTFTYPGVTQLTGSQCKYTAKAPGTITITVPTADVSETNPLNSTLYSVTASTMSLAGPAEQPAPVGGIGGQPANLIDVAPGYDFQP